MTSKYPETFINQMSKKYPDVGFELLWPDFSQSGIILITHENRSTQISVSHNETGKLIFKENNREEDNQEISFRRTVSRFLNPPKGTKSCKDRIQGMIKLASDIELELVWIPRMMERQMEEEVEQMDTQDRNGVGLNRADAWPITRAFKRIQEGGHLYGDESEDIKNRLLKYWKQYSSITN